MQENLKIKLQNIYYFNLILFILLFYSQTLNYGRTFDDDLIIDRFIKSEMQNYFRPTFIKFHFYPIYF